MIDLQKNRFYSSASCFMAAVAATFIAPVSAAQDYPVRPVRGVVAATPGGGPDTITRLITPKLSDIIKQPVVIDNRSGAAGNIGTEIVAKSTPDGYTLLVSVPSLTTSPLLFKQLGYDVFRDLASVSLLTTQPYLLVVHPSVRAGNLQELIALAKATKGRLSFASPGVGQMAHLGMELLLSMAKFEAVHVAYKGASLAMPDVLAGRVEIMMLTTAAARPQVQSGKLRAVATTGEKRSLTFPDIPTVIEQGIPGYRVYGWYGLHAPSKTPSKRIGFLRERVVEILSMKDVNDRITGMGVTPVGSTPKELDTFLREDHDKWSAVVKRVGISME